MAKPESEPTIARLRESMAANNVPAIRSALLGLSKEGRDELEIRLGKAVVDRMMRAAGRGPSRGYLGRVVVIHGIMGGKLATVDETGDEDLVWVNYFRLLEGRIAGFKLDAAGNQADPNIEVLTCGLLDEYLPLVMELEGTWQVLPFAFDWRLDIDRSAARLDEAIRGWAGGQPAHIIAHSMGGLVSRRFIQKFPQTWASMADGSTLESGGRLIMLGTPNRGSFAISFVLSGEEKTVKMLAKLDSRHDLPEILEIINTFPGSYQMLPSPKLSFDDDRAKLFSASTWGGYPVPQALLDKGKSFQTELDPVIDAHRLLYVAGYDQETPYRIRVDGQGRFSYKQTLAGDGRVPHELGLLPDVPTYYVREIHGDLPSNGDVLAALPDLLRTGETTRLPREIPSRAKRAVDARWKSAREVAPEVPPEVDAILGANVRARGATPVGHEEAMVLESALVSSFAGASRTIADARSPAAVGAKGSKGIKRARRASAKPVLEVMWGDIVEASGEVYACGHYQGVMPQRGELAIDYLVSGVSPREQAAYDKRRLAITSLTRRGMLQGEVGDVSFFPIPGSSRRVAVIAGMGHPGSFGRAELERLGRNLTEAVVVLPDVRTVNTLLIGSGIGNLPVWLALEGLLEGVNEALAEGERNTSIRTIRIVEMDWRQARVISARLNELADRGGLATFQVRRDVVAGPAGRFSEGAAFSALIAAAAGHVKEKEVQALLSRLPTAGGLRGAASKKLEDLRKSANLLDTVQALNLGRLKDDTGNPEGGAQRLSFLKSDSGLRVAAIDDGAVVPERIMPVRWDLIEDLIGQMVDPDPGTIKENADLLAGFVVPADFRSQLTGGSSVIVEVDRTTARIQWEMLSGISRGLDATRPLAIDKCVARQLRTTYSSPPTRAASASTKLRALVIGDPGDEAAKYSLPGARREAIEVYRLLKREPDIDVTALIGSEDADRTGELEDFEPATLLATLKHLRRGYDILHFAGHGNFEDDDKERTKAGWIFGTGYFTARELGCIDTVPRLVVANACLSGLFARETPDPKEALRQAQLLPGLADEFFMRGVRNYVGTAWSVNDEGAILFAQQLYAGLFEKNFGASLGTAMLRARRHLKEREDDFGALWAAYHHYGDPGFSLRLGNSPIN